MNCKVFVARKVVQGGVVRSIGHRCAKNTLVGTGFCLRHLKARLTAIEREQAARAKEYRRLLDAYSMLKRPGSWRWGKK